VPCYPQKSLNKEKEERGKKLENKEDWKIE
jgi:hypothetical protein